MSLAIVPAHRKIGTGELLFEFCLKRISIFAIQLESRPFLITILRPLPYAAGEKKKLVPKER
jgi:hypothetical protein